LRNQGKAEVDPARPNADVWVGQFSSVVQAENAQTGSDPCGKHAGREANNPSLVQFLVEMIIAFGGDCEPIKSRK